YLFDQLCTVFQSCEIPRRGCPPEVCFLNKPSTGVDPTIVEAPQSGDAQLKINQ
ncbi:MAG: hypothetical protein ACI8QH_001486, partial [Flammeovirgaceae bacterium]